jgi:hypothetical protein
MARNGLTLHRADGEAGRPVEAGVLRFPVGRLSSPKILSYWRLLKVIRAPLPSGTNVVLPCAGRQKNPKHYP